MEKKLKVKLSTFQTDLTFNEWCERYNVGRLYQEPTRYFTGMRNLTMDTKMELISPKVNDQGKVTGLLDKIKTKIKWVEKIV
jgi:hypothetical protein